MRLSLRAKAVLYVALLHLPFVGLAWFALKTERVWLLAVEALFAISLVVGLSLIASFFGTLDLLRSGAELLKESDFGTRFRLTGRKELDELVDVYNRMADHLREERVRLEEQDLFLDKVLAASPSGVVTLDLDGHVASVSPAAASMLGLPAPALVGTRPQDSPSALLSSLDAIGPGESAILPLPGGRRVKCQRSELLDRGFARTFYVLDELTEELRASERSAYEKLIRVMSHEVNNTLGAARSLLQSCLVYKDQLRDEDRADFEGALGVVLSRTGQLAEFMKGFADVVRLREPRLSPCDVGELVRDAERLFAADARQRRISWRTEIAEGLPRVALDRLQIEQVLVNVLKNALEAAGDGGEIAVRLTQDGGRVRAVVEDSGPGLGPEVKAQLFTPFFTTKENGQGIGLTLVKEILTRHRFGFSLESAPGGPTRFTIQM